MVFATAETVEKTSAIMIEIVTLFFFMIEIMFGLFFSQKSVYALNTILNIKLIHKKSPVSCC